MSLRLSGCLTGDVVDGIPSLMAVRLSVTLMERTRVVRGMEGVVTQLSTVLIRAVLTTGLRMN